MKDVYGAATGPNEAEIVIESDEGEQIIAWKDGQPASDLMQRAAVFDSKAAELYVDEGNQIRFLPFGLALPHRLNELILALRDLLEKERHPVQLQLAATRVEFPTLPITAAQKFYKELDGNTADTVIDAVTFTAEDEERLHELNKLLAASTAEAADHRALADWVDERLALLESHAASLSDEQIELVLALGSEMHKARAAADEAAMTKPRGASDSSNYRIRGRWQRISDR